MSDEHLCFVLIPGTHYYSKGTTVKVLKCSNNGELKMTMQLAPVIYKIIMIQCNQATASWVSVPCQNISLSWTDHSMNADSNTSILTRPLMKGASQVL